MSTAQKLVEQYVPLANKLAFRKKRTLPRFISVDELKSAAYLGLVEAANRFDPKMGVAFSTFAYPRIFGAIHDYLRERGWLKCRVRMLSLDDEAPGCDGCSLGAVLAAKPETDLEETFDFITSGLEPQAKSVLRHYFVNECSMKEVGDKFGVSESRISQLIKNYRQQIRSGWEENEFHMGLAA